MEIQIRNGMLSAVITTKGGELISLKKGGTEYIWQGDAAYWSGRNPILFPVVGNLKGAKTEIGGMEYSMNRHGFARDMEWELCEQGSDYVTLMLRESTETLARYPFAFSLKVTHRLLSDGFSTTFLVANRDCKRMPFCIGAHTAFNCPMHDGERFEDYDLVFETAERAHTLKLTAEGLVAEEPGELILDDADTLPLSYTPFERLDTLAFDGLKSKKVALLHRENGGGVELDFGEFPLVAFWTKPGAPFICLEPWQGHADSEKTFGRFDDKKYVFSLNTGEIASFCYKIRIIDRK